MSLNNTRVLVIGGTSGIGLGVATAAAERGATPIVVSRRQSSVDKALAELPYGATGVAADLTDPSVLDRLADEVGDIDHLVYTAGEPLQLGALADLTPDVVVGFFQTRFVGALLSVRTFAPRIRTGGSVTLTSGTAGDRPGLGVLPSSVCGAIEALTRALTVELAPLRVNAVAPGPVRTPLWDALSDSDRLAVEEQFAQRVPVGRIGDPADSALAYVYLMEQEFSTGVVLTVDGGIRLV